MLKVSTIYFFVKLDNRRTPAAVICIPHEIVNLKIRKSFERIACFGVYLNLK